jgi:hypothetical protein
VGKLTQLIAMTACLWISSAHPVYACPYNVREVGFVDLGLEPYRFVVYLPGNVSTDEVSKLTETMAPALAETNIRFEPVVAGADTDETALELAKTNGISHSPAAILVSPDGPSLPVNVSLIVEGGAAAAQSPLGQAASSALEGILDSPTRRQILDTCAQSYGAVLLIEGPDSQRNAMAREAVTTAISRIGAELGSLPKPIGKPPALVVLERAALARERVLLWALRRKPEDINEPHAAVFYGRGRWIGPVFAGEILTADNLTQLLAVIGADCECGLDQQWLQGTMLPARWDGTLQQKVAQSLGFDPESPLVRAEMVALVRRGMGGSDDPGTSLAARRAEAADDAGRDRGRREDDGARYATPSFAIEKRVLAGSLAGMALFVGLASLAIVLKARRP